MHLIKLNRYFVTLYLLCITTIYFLGCQKSETDILLQDKFESASSSWKEVYLTGNNGGSYHISDGKLSINVASASKFDIASGTGFVVDNTTDPENSNIIKVQWTTKSAVTVSGIAIQNTSWIGINASGIVIQQELEFTPEQLLTIIQLGTMEHATRDVIRQIDSIPYLTYNFMNLFDTYALKFGFINASGNSFNAEASGLTLSKTSGVYMLPGVNYDNSNTSPNLITISGYSTMPLVGRILINTST